MGKPWEKYGSATQPAPALAPAPPAGPWAKYGGTSQTNPMEAIGADAQQEYQRAGAPPLPPSATIKGPPVKDPLMPKGGWTPGQKAQQEARAADTTDPFRVGGGRPPAPAATAQPQNWNDQIASWISDNITPVAQRAGESVGAMVLGQRPGGEAVAEMGKNVGGGLSEWGATAFRDPVDASNQAIETLDPAHQFAYAYNDANDATKAAASGDWEKVGKELKDLSLSGSFAAMSVLPGNMTYNGLKAATGKAGPSIAGQLFKPGPTAADRAADILIKKMKADGLTLDDLRTVQRSLANRGDSGVYETFSELGGLSEKSSGANLRGLAMALGSIPGAAQEAILARVAQNAEQLPKRTSRAASRATGQDASKAAATLDELERRLKTESGPLYQKFYDSPVEQQIYDAQIAPVLNAPHGQAAMERAARGLGVEAASLQASVASGAGQATPALQRTYEAAMALKNALDGKATGPLPPLALDHVKRAFDDLIDEAGQGTYTGGNLRSAKRNFAESVSRATGGTYGDALGFYEGGKRLEEAFDIGLNSLKQPTWQLERSMNAGMRGSPFSAGEVEAIAMGVARHIEDLIETNDQAALTKLLKGKALKNLSTALGDPKAAAKFEQSIQRLAANREWGRRVSGGSDTAMRQAAIDDASRLEEDPVTRVLDRAANSTAPPSVFGAAWQAVAKPAANAATDAYRRLKYPGIRDEEVNAALAPMMGNAMTKGNLDQVTASIEARLAAKNPKRLPPPPPGGGGGQSNQPKLPAPKANALASPPSPPVKAGFGGSKPLDMSEPARMQRAREQGFDVDTPWFHAGRIDDAFDAEGGELGMHIGDFSTAARFDNRSARNRLNKYLVRGAFAEVPDLGNFQTPYTYLRHRAETPSAFDARYADMWRSLDKVAGGFPRDAGPAEIEFIKRKWRATVHDAARRNEISGWEYINNSEGAGEPSRVVFFGDAVRKTDAAFDPSQSGSSKLMAGMGASPEAAGAIGGGAAGYALAPDQNGDGVVDAQERAAGGLGGFVSGIAGAKIVRGAGNALRNTTPPKGPPSGPAQQTFGGVKAKTADLKLQRIAQDMEKAGASRDQIWKETGWFKGNDGKWRFEIDDSGSKMLPPIDYRNTKGWKAKKGTGRDKGRWIVYDQHGRGVGNTSIENDPTPQDAIDVVSRNFRIFGTGNQLGNQLGHPELYKAYPDLAKIQTRIGRSPTEEGFHESYANSPWLEGITASAPDDAGVRSVLLHEAGGHGVQAREGFATGGSPDVSMIDDVEAIGNAYNNTGRPWNELDGNMQDNILRNAAMDRYRRLAGEVEARNVQTRRDFTPEERRARPPWTTQDVPDEQQIVRYGNGQANSAPLRKPDEPFATPPQPTGEVLRGPSLKGGGGGGGFRPPPRDDWPAAARYALGGTAGSVGGTAVGGAVGATADLDGDGVAGTINDQRIGAGVGLGLGVGTGVGAANMLRRGAIKRAALPSGKSVEESADAILQRHGYRDGVSAQKAVIATLKDEKASAERISQAERVLAAIERRAKDGNAILSGEKLQSNVASIKPPPTQAGFGGSPGKPGGKGPPGNALKGPPKKAAAPMSRAAEEATRELKAARSAYTRAANKWVMKDDRELRVKPLEERVVAAEQKLAQVLKNDARIKVAGARIKGTVEKTLNSQNRSLLAGVGIGVGVGSAAILAANAIKGPPAIEKPINPTDPGYYFSTIKNNEDAMSSIQIALKNWDLWPEDTDMTGNYGRVTKDALRRWRADRGLNPDEPMSRKDVERLLAGPRGYQDDQKKWRYGDGAAPTLP